jgi:hypothetical protein
MAWKKDPDVKTIAIIPCTSQKSEIGGPAKEVWIGGHFQLTLAYVEYFFDQIYIMSYKYGLIEPERYIEPYDIDMRIEKASQRIRWWYMLKDDIEALVDNQKPDLVALFTGGYERSRIVRQFIRNGCNNVIVPWAGLGTGYRQEAVYDGVPPFDYAKLAAGDYRLPDDYKLVDEDAEKKKAKAEREAAIVREPLVWEDEQEQPAVEAE